MFELCTKVSQKSAIFFSCFVIVSGLLAMDFINPSLPYIMEYFAVAQLSAKALIVYYFVGLGMSQFCYGAFSDNYGLKLAVLLAFGVTLLDSMFSAVSHSIAMLHMGNKKCLRTITISAWS